MTKEEFDSVTRDLLVAWFLEMYEYISGGEQAQKIEPPAETTTHFDSAVASARFTRRSGERTERLR